MPSSPPHRLPAEWEPHTACWLAWPSHDKLWKEDLAAAQTEFTALAEAIALGESLEVLVPTELAEKQAKAALGHLPARFHRIDFGDIWLRDTGPLFIESQGKLAAAACFDFNGWGGKYNLPHDREVAHAIASVSGLKPQAYPWVLEGGSIDVDGEGTCLTTRQCLLNPNRNPAMSQSDIEHGLHRALGITKLIWLEHGLVNDHTDGHVDTLARFVAPGKVVCMRATSTQDPNRETLLAIEEHLHHAKDAKGRPLEVLTIPSPGPMYNGEDELMPASYANFYIANATVVVPTYGSTHDKAAVAGIAKCFPHRKTLGRSAEAILSGGGAFPLHHAATAGDEMIQVAAIQCALGGELASNVARVIDFTRQAAAKGANVILPPELFEGIYFCQKESDEYFAWAKPLENHPTITAFQKLAKELGVVIPVSFFEKDGPHFYNSIAMVDADGKILGAYRKSHIPDGPGSEEKFYFRPGNTGFKAWKTKFGMIGVGICWDQWFPECARAMMLQGAEILLYPTAIGSEPQAPELDTKDSWQKAMIGHAISNVVPVVAANRIGDESGQIFYGHSFAEDHRGTIVAELGRKDEGIITASFDLDEIRKNRAAFGFFRDRRPTLYKNLVEP